MTKELLQYTANANPLGAPLRLLFNNAETLEIALYMLLEFDINIGAFLFSVL